MKLFAHLNLIEPPPVHITVKIHSPAIARAELFSWSIVFVRRVSKAVDTSVMPRRGQLDEA